MQHDNTLTMKITNNSYQHNFNVGFQIDFDFIYYAFIYLLF